MSRTSHFQKQIAETASQWVARTDAGLSGTERMELERWLAENPLHSAAYERYRAIFSALGRPQRTGSADELQTRLAGLAQARRVRRLGVVSSVMVAAVIGLGAWFWSTNKRGPETHFTATAKLLLPQQQVLPDGSRMEFPVGTEVRVDFTSKARRVRLTKGEAMFAVVKHPDWPFVVEAGGVEFRAVGTAFVVQLNQDSTELLVTEGRVAVERAGEALAVDGRPTVDGAQIIDAGNRISVRLTSEVHGADAITKTTEEEISARLAWRTPRAEFSGAPLQEIVDLMNRQNQMKLVLDDPSLADVQLSGIFPTGDLDSLVRALELGFDVHAERRASEIRLSRVAPQ